MSTVFYGYQIDKDKWWELVDRIRTFYKEKDGFILCVKEATEKNNDVGLVIELIHGLKGHADVTLQVFEMPNNYIFRVLEQGYFFMNNHEKFPVETTFYDDRSDEGEDKWCSIELVDTIDGLIKKKHFFMVEIVGERSLLDVMWEVSEKISREKYKENKLIGKL